MNDCNSERLREVGTLKDSDAHRAYTLSIVTPIYNEEANICPLVEQILETVKSTNRPFEIIAVNDGSRDQSETLLRRIAAVHSEFKVVNFRRNYGQTAALMAGFEHAKGDVIISIDSDLQNDPSDIPVLLQKLDEGYDVVSGWRQERKDAALRRTFISRVANLLISRISGVHLHDYGCTLKAYRREVIKDIRLYGEMHRFIPIYASWMGARVTEIPVRHHPRIRGESKYGLERVFKVLLDLVVVKFLEQYVVKPIYVFGGFGIFSLLLSVIFFSYMLFLKFFHDTSMISTPLPLLSAMTFLVGIMSILMGLLAEILMRTYFESQKRSPYSIRSLVNCDPST